MISRRDFLKLSAAAAASNILPSCKLQSSFKNIVFINLNGGMSQIESFDYKPDLYKHENKTITVDGEIKRILKPQCQFKQYGESGQWISDNFPQLGKIADDISIIKSCTTNSNIHGFAAKNLLTNSNIINHPSIANWISYCMNSSNPYNNITLFDRFRTYPEQSIESLESELLGAKYNSLKVDTIFLNKYIFEDLSYPELKNDLALASKLNSNHSHYSSRNYDIENFHTNYNFFKNVFNAESSTQKEKEKYGIGKLKNDSFAKNLLLTKRLLKKGTQVITVHHGGLDANDNWDMHDDISRFNEFSSEIDLPLTSFIQDLKQEGLLSDTLVVVWTEFGRMPFIENIETSGRNHNKDAFSIILAGANIKQGLSIGETDNFSLKADSEIIKIENIHQTIFKAINLQPRAITSSFRNSFTGNHKAISKLIL